jgi:hypothetical protein
MNRIPNHYAATVYDSRGETELGTVVAESYAAVWQIAKDMTPHPVLKWVQGGPTGKEIV